MTEFPGFKFESSLCKAKITSIAYDPRDYKNGCLHELSKPLVSATIEDDEGNEMEVFNIPTDCIREC